jgi:hypothetical protein
MSDPKTNAVLQMLSQEPYKNISTEMKSDIMAIMKVAFDVKHFDAKVLSYNGVTGTSIFRMKKKLDSMCEVAFQLLEQLQTSDQSMYSKVVNDLRYL